MLTRGNKIGIVSGVMGAIMAVAAISVGSGAFNIDREIKATSLYSISLSSTSNKLAATTSERTDGSVQSTSGYTIAITYDDYSLSNGNWGKLSSGGYLYNTTVIKGLQLIALTLSSASSFTVYWGDSAGATTSSQAFSSVSSASCVFDTTAPGYFKIVADADATIVSASISFSCKASNGLVEFGSYPQTKVTDTALISTLNTAAGTLPSNGANQLWTDYGYYYGNGTTITDSTPSYMWYKDVTEGDERYRGVYFTSYRPYYCVNSSSTLNSNQDDNGYSTLTRYWFKFEPLKWRMIAVDGSKCFLMSSSIIDAHQYYRTLTAHVSKSVYANNYAESDIRAWLNSSFYGWAFSDSEKAKIQTTVVDNRKETTANTSSNKNACSDTSDKIFLLSFQDAVNPMHGLYSDNNRMLKFNDYSKCQGILKYSGIGSPNGCGSWWLRSPQYSTSGDCAREVYSDGGTGIYSAVYNCAMGVAPAFWVSL